MNRVSICIPCHNAASYIGPALDSVLAQDWPDLEVIVVDDGSTDGSAEVLSKHRERITLISERFGRATKARNCALEVASGDYVKFFDADDLLSPGHVRLQMERLAGRTDAVASSAWGRFYENDLETFRFNPQSVWRDMEAADWLVEAWADARPMMQPGMFLIPRKILEKSGAWDEELTLIDDFEFFARVLCHAGEVLFTPGATLCYRSGLQGSLSGQKSRKAVESAFHSLLRGTGHLLMKRNDDAARLSCANILQDFIHTYYPDHRDLRDLMAARIKELGGASIDVDGPWRFQQLRRLLGWRMARRIQRFAGR